MSPAIEIRVPGDKSLSHRALIFAALATGTSRIRDMLRSADVESTAGVLRALGVAVPPLGDDIAIHSKGSRMLTAPGVDLDCGNSGTTTRLMAGVSAGCDFRSRFVGDASLSRRPMRRVARPLEAMGARVELEAGDGLPMIVQGGSLHSIAWTSETASAQIKSAILLAGVVGGVDVEVTEPSRSRDHTERLLRALGARVEIDGTRVRVAAVGSLHALDVRVPADPSSAAFLIALAVLSPGTSHRGAERLPQSHAHRLLRRTASHGRERARRAGRDAGRGGDGKHRRLAVRAHRRVRGRIGGAIDDR